MIIKKKVHHPNDISVKYFQATEAKELFNYFKLPGKFVKNYSPRVIKREGSELDKEINKSDLMDVIEYELDYRDQAHKAEIKEIINTKNKEITAKDKEISEKDKENARLKEIFAKNGISY